MLLCGTGYEVLQLRNRNKKKMCALNYIESIEIIVLFIVENVQQISAVFVLFSTVEVAFMEINSNLMFGPPPVSPLYQGDCTGTPDPNPYFPKPATSWMPQAPFWYKGYPGGPCPEGPNWPVGNLDDFKWDTLPQPVTGKTLLEVFEIDRPERYLPGEVYRNEPVKRPIEDLSKTANCQHDWVPKDPSFYCEFQPTREMMNPPLLLDGVLHRKADTYNSYMIPEEDKIELSCEGVEDTETKNKKRWNYLEPLKYADTRPDNFKCEPDTKVYFDDACKIPNSTVKVTPGILRKIWRPGPEVIEDHADPNKSNNDCHVCK